MSILEISDIGKIDKNVPFKSNWNLNGCNGDGSNSNKRTTRKIIRFKKQVHLIWERLGRSNVQEKKRSDWPGLGIRWALSCGILKMEETLSGRSVFFFWFTDNARKSYWHESRHYWFCDTIPSYESGCVVSVDVTTVLMCSKIEPNVA